MPITPLKVLPIQGWNTADLVAYQPESIVSRKILQKEVGTITLFAFDKGQALSEHTAPFEALIQVVEGSAEVMTEGTWHAVPAGSAILLPAGKPHAVKAPDRFKMLLTMIRSN